MRTAFSLILLLLQISSKASSESIGEKIFRKIGKPLGESEQLDINLVLFNHEASGFKESVIKGGRDSMILLLHFSPSILV